MILCKLIVAAATSLKKSAICVIRISFGFISKKIIYFFLKKFFYKKIKPKIINHCFFYNIKNCIVDRVLVLYFPKPKSYTGEDLIEIHCHGSQFIVKYIIHVIINFLKIYKAGLAKRGEFTKKALFNNKINIFDLESLLNYSNKNNKFLNIINNKLNNNFKKTIFKFYNILKELEILIYSHNLRNCLIDLKKFNYYINNIKRVISLIISKNRTFKNENSIILIGYTNCGKSTFINNFSKNNFSSVSSVRGTTRDILIKKLTITSDLKHTVFDTPGFNNFKSSLEFLNFNIFIKNLKKIKILIYIFDSIFTYNFFFYYIKKKIKSFQIFIKIINKIDLLNYLPYIQINIFYKIKNIKIKISSKKKYGVCFFKSEIKRLFFKNFKNTDSILLKILKKIYKHILKLFIFINNKNYSYFLKEIQKIKNIINLILMRKNKIFFNNIFKKFCLGK